MALDERTLVIIKPAFFRLREPVTIDIDKGLGEKGVKIALSDLDSAPSDLVQEHYIDKKGEVYFPWMMEAMAGQPLRLLVYEGPDIIDTMMEVIGRETDPSLCAPDTIRFKYAGLWENTARSRAEKRMLESGFHRSRQGDAEREIGIWQRYLLL